MTPSPLEGSPPSTVSEFEAPDSKTRDTKTPDFDIDLNPPVEPKKADEEPLTTEELDKAVESFLTAFKR